MPLICFLQNFRRKVAETSRANLLQSTEIVRCCRIIVKEVHSTEFVNDKNFGSVESALKKAEDALEAARTKNPDVCEAFENATNSIVEVGRIMQLDSLLGIEARMNEAKINDNHVGYQKSLRVDKHLKRLERPSVDKSPRITLDIRVRRDIDDDSKQELIEVKGKGNDTLDIVLLSMKLNRSSRMGQNPHFYNRTFPGAIKDLVARRNHRLEPLPFDCFLSEIPRSSERLVLYCLHDHESGNYIVLRYGQSLRSFTNLWEITLKSAFVLKDVLGIIEHAETSIDVSHAEFRLTKKQVSSESVREEMQGVWPKLLREVHKSFETASNICWTIEAPYSMPIPKPWVPQRSESSSTSTLASITPTPVPPPSSVISVAEKGRRGEKPVSRSWVKAMVARFTGI
ncbi:hypothetical protein ARMGADRAFT_1004382 [Armillaria gallica]|uniref:Uncharacterized protein n=1 Tax=Armillaria gallica TaxID=47427 RepID=A0A2H3ETA5_ARMGA|nr:hypothetical protein ARMGADRAFT_1004382 [Armillaria gallica]